MSATTRKSASTRRRAALCALLVTLLGSGAALAQSRAAVLGFDGEPPVRAFMAQRGGISLSQATAMALGRNPGRVVRAQPVQMGDRVVYEIRILGNDGRVRTVRVDAQTGAFL